MPQKINNRDATIVSARTTITHRPKPEKSGKESQNRREGGANAVQHRAQRPVQENAHQPPKSKDIKCILAGYDASERRVEDIDPTHGIGTPENKRYLNELRDFALCDPRLRTNRIVISSDKNLRLSTKSEVFQNLGNEMILLQEAYHRTPFQFNGADIMLYLSKDEANKDDTFFHTNRWINSNRCSIPETPRELITSFLKSVKEEYKDGERLLTAKDRDEITRRRYTSGLARLVETKQAKACLKSNNVRINENCRHLAIKIRDQHSEKFYDSMIIQWMKIQPEEYPVGRLRTTLMKAGGENMAKLSAWGMKNKLDPNNEKFDVSQFMAFHRFLSTKIDSRLKEQRDSVFSGAIMPLRGNQPRFPAASQDVDRHKIGITMRNISTESLPGYTDLHTRPIDYKMPSKDLEQQIRQVDHGHPLACGLSGTTNIHLWGLYASHQDNVIAAKEGGAAYHPLSPSEMLGFLHLLASTLCLDGGHSRYEVIKAAILVHRDMKVQDLPKENREFVENLGKALDPIDTGYLYDDFLRPVMQAGYMAEEQMHNAYSDSIVHLRNGKDIANKDYFDLRYRNRADA